MDKNCKYCNQKFHAKLSQHKQGKAKFCSRKCYASYLRSVAIPRFNIAKYLKENPEIRKKANDKKRGKKLSQEHKSKISKTLTGKEHPGKFKKGQNLREKHPNWKGGKWCWAKKFVLERDKYTCQHCGLKEKDILDIAHLHGKEVKGQDRRYINHIPEHLIALCPNCHRKYDLRKITLR